MTEAAPAYYAKGTTGWRAWWTLLHPPYTLLHLSFVVVGAALAPAVDWPRLGFTLLAFLLGMGLAAHALDELNGRPLRTRISGTALKVVAILALTGAMALGTWGALHYAYWAGFAFIGAGAFLVLAYNLEWWNGRVHTDLAFAAAWGAFPALTGFYAQTGTVEPIAVFGAAYAFTLSLAQRHLSTPARRLRRHTVRVEGRIVHDDGRTERITRDTLLKLPENGLRAIVWTGLLAAVALLFRHA